MDKRVNAFLPLRAGSERVLRKNIRSFGGVQGGLCKIKLEQLLTCKLIDKIIVSTNDRLVFEIAESFNSPRIQILDRPEHLASSAASTDELIKYVPSIMPEGHILWTHATSPFVSARLYDQIIQVYFSNLEFYDSLMTVTKVQKFLWSKDTSINYDRNREKWPRTQTLDPVWEVNSAAFVTSKKTYLSKFDRIGDKPFLFELEQDSGFDVDWPIDFDMAEFFYKNRTPDKLHQHS